MKKLALAMLTVVGMALFMVLPAKACTSYYVGKDCAKDGYALYGRTEDLSSKKDKVYKVIDGRHLEGRVRRNDFSGSAKERLKDDLPLHDLPRCGGHGGSRG